MLYLVWIKKIKLDEKRTKIHCVQYSRHPKNPHEKMLSMTRSLEGQGTVKNIWEIRRLRHRELINLVEFTGGIIMSGTFVVFTEWKFFTVWLILKQRILKST